MIHKLGMKKNHVLVYSNHNKKVELASIYFYNKIGNNNIKTL